MKFGTGIGTQIDAAAREPGRAVYERAQLLEELGFDYGVVPHHRFTPGYPSAPWVLLAAIAARTTRLRLATGIFILPLYHPLEVAEQIATLDELSGGRAILGAGIGYRTYEYEAAGLSLRQRGSRMTECLQVLRRAWTEEKASFAGRHFQFQDVAVLPRPVQQPHPPIWIGAQMPPAVERAARLGDGWMADNAQTLGALKPLVARYRALAADEGRSSTICLMRSVVIASSREEVERNWLPRALRGALRYWRSGVRFADDEGIMRKLDASETVTLQDYAPGRVVAGTPDDCIREIQRCREETGCEYLQVNLAGAEGSRFQQATFELFAREVMPAFRD